MTMGELLRIQPSELKFQFEVRKQSSCAIQLANKTDQYVAFKVKTTNPKRYCVRPNAGVVLPYSVCNVTVNMQAQKEAPPDMQCRDKFLVQSVIVPNGTTNKDINQEMFNRDNGKFVDEFKLRVVFIPANPPSPVPEEDEEGTSPGTSSTDDDIRKSSLYDTEMSTVSKLQEERAYVSKQNEKLLGELDLMRQQTSQGRRGASSIVVLLFGLILGILVGYFIRK
ncbi:Plant VAMP membrane family protein [Perilla frutescens var. hirtella]|uniref:Plant VAMP membrane family protein n=1 Tax=Perilla frutescens var. hirtella TaxID=608512 RepID=A0AAD4P118_PERFH|nr:Plant VAMP membrane family protein [Perilla frutescens var. hirtella]